LIPLSKEEPINIGQNMSKLGDFCIVGKDNYNMASLHVQNKNVSQ
jgi:hypothetical protein